MGGEQNFGLGGKLQREKKCRNQHGSKSYAWYVNLVCPIFYLVVFAASVYLGIADILPQLYKDSDVMVLRIHQAFGCIIAFEMMINWFFIRYMDSCYKPKVHGTKPVWNNTGSGVTKHRADDNNSKCYKDIRSEYISDTNGSSKRTKIFKMLVATSLPNADGEVKHKAFDYWSWTPCVVCQHWRPPRCHHCFLCDKCVLKRDHHCFFAGSCIGVNNQRHFVVFIFWTFVGCVYSFLNIVPFALTHVVPYMAVADTIAPITFIRAIAGYQTYFVCLQVSLGWCLTCFAVFSGLHLLESFSLIFKSQTTFEEENDMKVTDSRTRQERIRSVFGDCWLLNFIFPCHWLYPVAEDPVFWPSVKLC